MATDATEPAGSHESPSDSGFGIAVGVVVGGRYRLDRLLGEGGMGIVWSAHHTVTRRPVALKFLKGCRDEASRRRLVREARAAGSIHHPGIVAVHDVIESDDGEPALVMDLLEGESLRARLDRESPLSLDETAALLVEICDALGAAHAKGVIHRDLKPENLFRLKDGSMRILDFGVAKIMPLDPKTAQSAGTQSGELVGTPMFMSPEQVFGERDVDHRSDIWAMGLIAYECLTGKLPTASENIGQVLKTILTDNIKPLKVEAPHLPDDVCKVVDRMLSFDRAGRPWSAGEVATVFARVSGLDAPVIYAPRALEQSMDRDSVAEPSKVVPVGTRTGTPAKPRRLALWMGIPLVVGATVAAFFASRTGTPADASRTGDAPTVEAARVIGPEASTPSPAIPPERSTGRAALGDQAPTLPSSSDPSLARGVAAPSATTIARSSGPRPLGSGHPVPGSTAATTQSAVPTPSAEPPTPSNLQSKVVKTSPF